MDTKEIEKVIQDYFDAGNTADGEKMANVFHEVAHLYAVDEQGGLVNWDIDFFSKRVSSTELGFPQYNEILSIDFTGENSAVARVKVRVRDTIFTDILSFLRLGGQWKIIAKVFTGVPADQ